MSKRSKKHKMLDAGFCRQILGCDGHLTLTVEGVSMEPVLRRGQRVDAVVSSGLVPGQCYLYEGGQSLLVHRLVRVDISGAWFLGDNNVYPELVTLQRIAGIIYDRQSCFFHFGVNVINRLYIMLAGVVGRRGANKINRVRGAGIRGIYLVEQIIKDSMSFLKERI